MEITKKRIFAVIAFSFVLGLTIKSAVAYSIPDIISIFRHIDSAEGRDYFNNSPLLGMALDNIYVFFTAAIAAYLSHRKSYWIGFLANLWTIGIVGFVLAGIIFYGVDNLIGNLSAQLFLSISFATYVISSCYGSFYGYRFYDPKEDLDKELKTFFGIKWGHYFWIFPLILYPFFASIIVSLYSGVVFLLSGFYIAIHPSLWLQTFFSYSFLLPLFLYGAIYGTFYSFMRFFQLMQYNQHTERGIKLFIKLIWFGVGVPIITYFLANSVSSAVHNLPSYVTDGDWKVWLILFGLPYLVFLLSSTLKYFKSRFA